MNPLEIRATDDGGVNLTGYACVTGVAYEMPGFSETVLPGSFKRTLNSDPDVFLLVEHGIGGQLPLARTRSGNLHLEEDQHGLRFTASLDPADPDVASLRSKMTRGDVDSASFAFKIDSQTWSDDFTQRTIEAVNLAGGDVSVVHRGANPAASATIDRGMGLSLEQREVRAARLGKQMRGTCVPGPGYATAKQLAQQDAEARASLAAVSARVDRLAATAPALHTDFLATARAEVHATRATIVAEAADLAASGARRCRSLDVSDEVKRLRREVGKEEPACARCGGAGELLLNERWINCPICSQAETPGLAESTEAASSNFLAAARAELAALNQ